MLFLKAHTLSHMYTYRRWKSLVGVVAIYLILIYDSTAQFSSAIVVDTDIDYPKTLVVADIDGDGDMDLVYANTASGAKIYWRSNDGTGQFGPSQVISTEAYVEEIEAVDIDDDGDMDILCARRGNQSFLVLLRNNGTGTSWVRSIPISSIDPVTLCTLDFDGDGDLDIVSAPYGSAQQGLVWSRNQGGGSFSFVLAPIDAEGYGLSCVRSGDMDGDGDLDIVAAYWSTDEIAWYRTTGDVTNLERQVISSEVTNPNCIDLADLDGDGDLDVLSASTVDDQIAWYANDGSGQFGPQQVIDMVVHTAGFVLASDLNGDGLQDIIASHDGKALWYKALAPGVFSEAIIIGLKGLTDAVASDIDQDGDLDLLFTQANLDLVAWYKSYQGSPFRISGSVFVDQDGSGSPTAGDMMVPWLIVSSDPFISYPMTGDNGAYVMHVVPGSYDISLSSPGPFWAVEPNGYVVSVDSASATSVGNDFVLTATIDTSVVSASLTWAPGPCGGVTSAWLSYSNDGTRMEQGSITLQLDSHYVYLSSDPPADLIEDNVLTWTYDSLSCFEVRQVRMEIQKPTSLFMGNTFSSLIDVTSLDDMNDTLATFHFISDEIHSCAYDPNDKIVTPGGYGEHHAVAIDQPRLDFTIRFQNTGTAPAFNVMLLDSISPNLDWSSVRVLGYSHLPSNIRIERNGELVVLFENIMLPDSSSDLLGSQGFISFRADLAPGLLHLTETMNTARIYFDYNEPIITNTTLTTLVDCALWVPQVAWAQVDLLEATEGDVYHWYFNGNSVEGASERFLEIDTPGFYACEVTSAYGCTSMSEEYAVITTGGEDMSMMDALVVPNPFGAEVRVVFQEPLSPAHELTLLDMFGRELRKWQGIGSSEVLIGRMDLSSGVYLLRMTSTDGQVGLVRIVAQ
jgi:uncharacterized repeat protein (TIGR01451 family)